MSAGAISGLGSRTTGSSGAFGQLKSDEFIKIMISEMTNQDPFQPQDSSKLLEQISSLRNIESQLSLQDSLQDVVFQYQLSAAGNMIGKTVTGLDASSRTITGVVSSVRVLDGKAVLELDTGRTLDMNRVTEIAGGPSAAS